MQDSSRQIAQMVNFIMDEARNKCEEINMQTRAMLERMSAQNLLDAEIRATNELKRDALVEEAKVKKELDQVTKQLNAEYYSHLSTEARRLFYEPALMRLNEHSQADYDLRFTRMLRHTLAAHAHTSLQLAVDSRHLSLAKAFESDLVRVVTADSDEPGVITVTLDSNNIRITNSFRIVLDNEYKNEGPQLRALLTQGL